MDVDPYSDEFRADFGAFLVRRGLSDEPSVKRAQVAAAESRERFDRTLLVLGILGEGALLDALASFLGLSADDNWSGSEPLVVPPGIDMEFWRTNRLLPISASETAISLVTDEPFDTDGYRSLAFWTGKDVRITLVLTSRMSAALEDLLTATNKPDPDIGAMLSDGDMQRLRDLASGEPVIRLVTDIIAAAVESGASDIHIEPQPDCLAVRYRLDGVLVRVRTLPLAMRSAVSSRLKIMAKLDIAEHRLPQDGRIRRAVRGSDIDIRVSCLPSAHGESIVLRLLDRERASLDLDSLGFDNSLKRSLIDLFQMPHGIILVTGPTGSGKTTTLYAALRNIDTNKLKVVTVEDPIEYMISGICQTQVQPQIGLDFARALRAILRQDPDVILIGEIRDTETARIAVQAALTGHLVLATLHTNSAAAAIGRLTDMGVEPFLIAATLQAVVGQRLVRRICSHCAEPAPEDAAALDINDAYMVAPQLRRGRGCAECHQSGYRGRLAVAELLKIDARIRELVHEARPVEEIEAAARHRGFIRLHDAARDLVIRGKTTLAEMARVAPSDAAPA